MRLESLRSAAARILAQSIHDGLRGVVNVGDEAGGSANGSGARWHSELPALHNRPITIQTATFLCGLSPVQSKSLITAREPGNLSSNGGAFVLCEAARRPALHL